ncbi:MAG TPA: response regulator transcription factor [Sphingobacteriaceae bacterium]
MKARILIADDHEIMLDGIEALLAQNEDIEVVGKVSDACYCLSYLCTQKPDILITDYNMPGMTGLQLLKEVKQNHPAVKVLFLSMHDESNIVQDAVMAGADGYILKKYAAREIMRAITIIAEGGQYWSPEVSKALTRGMVKEEAEPDLTGREIEILKLLVRELTSKEIAETLFVSERTVETHRKNLLRKTNSKNTVGLVKYAYTSGIVVD